MKTATILLVEDDASLGAATRTVLESHSFDVSWVRNVAHAISELCETRETPWDLMVLDLDLNGLRGESVVQHAHQTGCVVPPILIVSAQPDDECRASVKAVGALGMLRKPIHPAELLRIVHRVLAEH